jgi:hypothetical protein
VLWWTRRKKKRVREWKEDVGIEGRRGTKQITLRAMG